MSRDASIELDFGDGTHKFRLAWGELCKVQEACDAGPYVVLERLTMGTWRMEDIREVIRYGLIGGGMVPGDALKLVREYVEERPPVENVIFARVILSTGLLGAKDETPGESAVANPAETASTISPTES